VLIKNESLIKNKIKTLTRLSLILTVSLPTVLLGQTAMFRGQILDSTDNGYVQGAKIKFIKNDTTVFSYGLIGQFKVILKKSLTDSDVVSHPTLGSTTFAFSLSDKQVKDTSIHLPKSCKTVTHTDTCPKCKSNKDVIKIIYGMPNKKLMKQADKGLVRLGGCVVNDCFPKYYCKRDDFEF
jgi:hypothetical protein